MENSMCFFRYFLKASLSWVTIFSSFIAGIEGQGLYKLDLNEKAGEGIYVAAFQVF